MKEPLLNAIGATGFGIRPYGRRTLICPAAAIRPVAPPAYTASAPVMILGPDQTGRHISITQETGSGEAGKSGWRSKGPACPSTHD